MRYIENSDKQLEENLENLKAISKFKKNWNYGADPFPGDFIRWIRIILLNIDIQPQMFPTAAGSIVFKYEEYTDDQYLQFDLNINRNITMFYTNADGSHVIQNDNVLPQDISEIVDKFFLGELNSSI